MNRWIRIALVLMVGLGIVLGSAAPHVSVAVASPAEQSHGGLGADCDELHALDDTAHSDHENHCCIAGTAGAFIEPSAVADVFSLDSADSFTVRADSSAAGPLYGIFRPPRDA